MTVYVESVAIPAYSTMGYGEGHNNAGETVRFAGDHRPMRAIGEAIDAGEIPVVELEDWVILSIDKPQDPQ